MSKGFPKRAASRWLFVTSVMIGFAGSFWGALQFIRPDGNIAIGAGLCIGGSLMVAREIVYRWRYKQSLKAAA
ncbi:hypothetical protein NJC38_02195 [Pseudomonas sp. 21LCFQ010]|uniref:hypothetical protein n=1 Tax=Pseudomonas sp. 21LCFQ010 TaxID=2957506 RepID=UPI002097F7DD|nr:hypothetical protein [Pseudomonas sp. 21LCFQ010]MCO8160962.1 hypothetical protein [Pseudomonas sp. 21LCFQ010]